MNTVEWRPDTCNCVIQLQMNNGDYTPIESTTDRFGTTYNRVKCDRHSNLDDLSEHYNVVLQENQKKNQVYSDIKELNEDCPQSFNINNLGVLTFMVTSHLTVEQIDELKIKHNDVVFI